MDLFTIENLLTLMMLILLQAVLGFDNLLYISLESQRVAPEKQASVRRLGIALAVILRLILLFALVKVIDYFQDPFFHLSWTGVAEGTFNVHSVIVLIGGAFILYTATKEIWHMLSLEDEMHEKKEPQSYKKVLTMIVTMNFVFSFDSILTAVGMTNGINGALVIMIISVILSMFIMMIFANPVGKFVSSHPTIQMLALSFLILIGFMLVTESAHLSNAEIFGQHVGAIPKGYLYFAIAFSLGVEALNMKMRKNKK